MTGGISSRTCYTKLNFDFPYVRFLSLHRDPYVYISTYLLQSVLWIYNETYIELRVKSLFYDILFDELKHNGLHYNQCNRLQNSEPLSTCSLTKHRD